MYEGVVLKLNKPGYIGVIPTDTVYGVVARAVDNAAVARLYNLKHRHNKPGTVIAASIKQFEELGLKHRYLKAVEQFWPGAVSILIPTSNPDLRHITQGVFTMAVRVPANKELVKLLQETGPLLTTSANLPGEPVAKSIAEAKKYFSADVDFYVDGGELSNHLPSTIIRVIDDAVEVVRQGEVTLPDGTIAP